MNRLETELQHMLEMLAPPFFNAWKGEMWHKAKRLAREEPETFADLPMMLASSVQQQSSTSSEKPVEQPGTGASDPKLAGTPTTALPASTGQPSTSLREGS